MAPVLAWDGVTAVVPATKKAPAKTILSSATGVVRAGAGGGLCAVLGPSGSGKTTLLTILAGHEPPASGRLTLDGAPYDARTAARVGFVPQVDQLFSTLTVLETLEFAQEMRNGATPARKAGATRRECHDVLAQVGLERVADQRVGDPASLRRRGLSGGERKRLSVALELVHRPPALVLDEPTSGLDSAAALSLCSCLKKLAAEQVVVASLHQPSAAAFRQFDVLTLLGAGGTTLYFGPRDGALSHFEKAGLAVPPYTNPAEHYLDFAAHPKLTALDPLAKDVAADARALCAAAAKAPAARGGGEAGAPAAARRSLLTQFSLLLGRARAHNARNPAFLHAMMGRTLTLALVVASLYCNVDASQKGAQDRLGAMYFILTCQVMASSGSIRTFIAERDIVGHEVRGGLYDLRAYYVARSLAESLVQLGFALLFGVLCYGAIGLAPTAAQLAVFLATLSLVTLGAESWVVMIGAAMPDDRSAGVVSPVGLSLFLASGGFFVNTNSVPALFRLLNHANLFVYGFGALAVNEFSGLALHCDASELVGPPPLPPPQRAIARLVGVRWPDPRCPVERGEQVLATMALDGLTPAQNLAALGAIIVAYRLLGFLALRRRFRPRGW